LQALMTDSEPGQKLLEQFRQSSRAPSLADALRPQDWWEGLETVGGIGSALASLIYAVLSDGSPRGLLLAVAGLPLSSFSLRRVYEKFSVAPLHDRAKMSSMYLLAYDKTNPTYRDNLELAGWLESLIMAGKVR
jgi:hypothetical protein